MSALHWPDEMRAIAADIERVAHELETGSLQYHEVSSPMGGIESRFAALCERTKWAFLADPDLPDWFK